MIDGLNVEDNSEELKSKPSWDKNKLYLGLVVYETNFDYLVIFAYGLPFVVYRAADKVPSPKVGDWIEFKAFYFPDYENENKYLLNSSSCRKVVPPFPTYAKRFVDGSYKCIRIEVPLILRNDGTLYSDFTGKVDGIFKLSSEKHVDALLSCFKPGDGELKWRVVDDEIDQLLPLDEEKNYFPMEMKGKRRIFLKDKDSDWGAENGTNIVKSDSVSSSPSSPLSDRSQRNISRSGSVMGTASSSSSSSPSSDRSRMSVSRALFRIIIDNSSSSSSPLSNQEIVLKAEFPMKIADSSSATSHLSDRNQSHGIVSRTRFPMNRTSSSSPSSHLSESNNSTISKAFSTKIDNSHPPSSPSPDRKSSRGIVSIARFPLDIPNTTSSSSSDKSREDGSNEEFMMRIAAYRSDDTVYGPTGVCVFERNLEDGQKEVLIYNKFFGLVAARPYNGQRYPILGQWIKFYINEWPVDCTFHATQHATMDLSSWKVIYSPVNTYSFMDNKGHKQLMFEMLVASSDKMYHHYNEVLPFSDSFKTVLLGKTVFLRLDLKTKIVTKGDKEKKSSGKCSPSWVICRRERYTLELMSFSPFGRIGSLVTNE